MGSGRFAESYRQDLVLRRGPVAHLGTVTVLVAAVAFPFVMSVRWQVIGVFALISAVGALGLHVLTGLAGQVSLGHAAFLSVGAYTAAWLNVKHGMPAWVWIPCAGLAAALVGGLVAPLAARLRGLYLAVVTIALVFVSGFVWRLWVGLTGGSNGKTMAALTVNGRDLLRGADLPGITLNGAQAYWFIVLGVLALAAASARNIERTRIGRAFISVRERDLTAAVAGIPVTRTKMLAFVVSSFYAGVAGALLAAYLSYVNPGQWDLLLSIQYIAMVVIGGLGSVFGAIVGALFVVAIPELVRDLTAVLPFISTETSPDGGLSVELVSNFLYGAVIVAVLVFEPLGLLGLWQRFKGIWTTWPWSY